MMSRKKKNTGNKKPMDLSEKLLFSYQNENLCEEKMELTKKFWKAFMY